MDVKPNSSIKETNDERMNEPRCDVMRGTRKTGDNGCDVRRMTWCFRSWYATLSREWTVKQCLGVKLVNTCGRDWRLTERSLHVSASTTVNQTRSARRDQAGTRTPRSCSIGINNFNRSQFGLIWLTFLNRTLFQPFSVETRKLLGIESYNHAT